MRYLVGLGVLVCLARLLGWWPGVPGRSRVVLPPIAALTTAAGVDGDPCASVDRCVILYVTPWCPACKRIEPLVGDLRAELRSRGADLKVVVGGSGAAEAQGMASRLGAAAYHDANGSFSRALGVDGYPYWALLDRRQRVQARRRGARLASSGRRSDDVAANLSGLGL